MFENNKIDLSVSRILQYDRSRDMVLGTIPVSRCPQDGCTSCLLDGAARVPGHKLIPGDILIGAVFPVHQSGKDCAGSHQQVKPVSLCCNIIRTSMTIAQYQSITINADQNCVIDPNADQYRSLIDNDRY